MNIPICINAALPQPLAGFLSEPPAASRPADFRPNLEGVLTPQQMAEAWKSELDRCFGTGCAGP